MRCVALDTETTGLDLSNDRIVEIGCIELLDSTITGSFFHCYLNPERPNSSSATRVHGLKDSFLVSQPKFIDVANRFLHFISGALVIAHNAPFDIGFIDRELAIVGRPTLMRHSSKVIDTYTRAKTTYRSQRNSLDALCDRFKIVRCHRIKHGALIDALLLAQVHLVLESANRPIGDGHQSTDILNIPKETINQLIFQKAEKSEEERHNKMLQDITDEVQGQCVWNGGSISKPR